MTRPVFVVGAPRSGTSLLHWLLAAHPDLAYPDLALQRLWAHREVRALERLGVPLTRSRLLHRLSRPSEAEFEPGLAFLSLEPDLPAEGLFLWHDRALREPEALEPRHLRENPELASRIRSRYANLLRRTGKLRFLDKSPSFTVMLDAIRELYPDAHIVHIVRDGRAVVNSIAYGLKNRWQGGRSWWGPRPPNWAELEERGPVERACHQWTALVAEARRGGELFGDRYHELRYESLAAETADHMGRLFAELELPAFGADLYPAHLENRNYKWQERGVESFGDRIWTDSSAIDPDEYPHLEVMRPLLETLGYVERDAPLANASALRPRNPAR